MFQYTKEFKIGDKVKLLNTPILDGLKGTVRTTIDYYSVEFRSGDNGQSWIFDDNELDKFMLRHIQEDNLERWEE